MPRRSSANGAPGLSDQMDRFELRRPPPRPSGSSDPLALKTPGAAGQPQLRTSPIRDGGRSTFNVERSGTELLRLPLRVRPQVEHIGQGRLKARRSAQDAEAPASLPKNRKQGAVFRFLKIFGPGLITGAADDGPSRPDLPQVSYGWKAVGPRATRRNRLSLRAATLRSSRQSWRRPQQGLQG